MGYLIEGIRLLLPYLSEAGFNSENVKQYFKENFSLVITLIASCVIFLCFVYMYGQAETRLAQQIKTEDRIKELEKELISANSKISYLEASIKTSQSDLERILDEIDGEE